MASEPISDVKSEKAVELDEKHELDDKLDGSIVSDGIHDGLVFPTEEEKATLRRVSDTIPWNAYLIAFVELAERFSTNFIQRKLPPGSTTGAVMAGDLLNQAGALAQGQRASTGIGTFYQFWSVTDKDFQMTADLPSYRCYVTPLLGAYIADTYWGRFNTICVAVVIALIGHILLIVSALPGVIHHPDGALAAFVIALVIMGFGTGLFKANISPLVAEQYKRTRLFVITTKSGEKVIVDPSLTVSRVYMYFYLFINLGALIGQIGMSYSAKYVGFWLAFTLPTIVFLFCPIVLWYGRNRYIRSPPTGSILAVALRLFGVAAKGKWSINPVKTYKQMTADDFWENAKPSKLGDSKPNWMTFDDLWVDEVRRGLKACAVFCWFPIYWLTYNQLNNNLTSQAATMSTHGLPNDVLSNLDPFALVIFIPICDLLVCKLSTFDESHLTIAPQIYPALRRAGINFSALKKIAAGFYTGTAAMIWAAVLKVSKAGISRYILVAFSEIFASITGLEYAFTKAPINMRSLVMSVFLFTSAISAALGEAFVALSSDPLLVWNYGVMAVLAGVTGVVFWIAVRKLDAREDELNNLAKSKFSAGSSTDPTPA
ncbi:hypothetical protein DXG01_005781 [Tephrocybe rancida]|nr:hypothetical protein DXG01_005781 [Tephrocybe rancida]